MHKPCTMYTAKEHYSDSKSTSTSLLLLLKGTTQQSKQQRPISVCFLRRRNLNLQPPALEGISEHRIDNFFFFTFGILVFRHSFYNVDSQYRVFLYLHFLYCYKYRKSLLNESIDCNVIFYNESYHHKNGRYINYSSFWTYMCIINEIIFTYSNLNLRILFIWDNISRDSTGMSEWRRSSSVQTRFNIWPYFWYQCHSSGSGVLGWRYFVYWLDLSFRYVKMIYQFWKYAVLKKKKKKRAQI